MNYQYNADHLIEMAQEHQEADRYLQGKWWDQGKGCSLGCMFHSDVLNPKADNYFAAAERATGIPYTINLFQERIFEWLPAHEANLWTLQFYRLRPSEKDLSQVVDRLMLWILDDELRRPKTWEKITKFADCAAAVENVADLYRRKISGESISFGMWSAAARAAEYASRIAAEAAAEYAEYATDAAGTEGTEGAETMLRLRDQFVLLIQEAPAKGESA